MSFENLLNDLHALQAAREQDEMMKSMPAAGADEDDKKVAGAAADSGATVPSSEGGAEGAGPKGGDDPDPDGGEDNDPPMAKSFMYGEDGEPVEVIDATEMLKSLTARVEKTESDASAALGAAVQLLKSQDAALRAQGELIKSLAGKVDALGTQGRGRTSVVSVAEKPAPGAMAKSEPAGVSPQEFLEKALDAQRNGRLSGRDVSIAEGYLLKGLAVPADIVNRVFAS